MSLYGAKMIQHFSAPNDVNGNPQRCYVVYDAEASIIEVFDEGYNGRPEVLKGIPELPSFEVSISVYRWLIRMGQ